MTNRLYTENHQMTESGWRIAAKVELLMRAVLAEFPDADIHDLESVAIQAVHGIVSERCIQAGVKARRAARQQEREGFRDL